MNAKWLCVTQLAVLVAVATGVAWRSPDDVVEAKRFVLRDSKGAERGTWMINESVKGGEFPTFRLFGRNGKDAVSVSALDSGPGVTFYDDGGKHRLSLSYEDGQDCQITLFDSSGKGRINIKIDKANLPILECVDGDGSVTWSSSK